MENYRLTFMVDGVDITKGAKEKWDEIGGDEHPDLDWKSFYNGWAAGKWNLLESMNKDASLTVGVEPKNNESKTDE